MQASKKKKKKKNLALEHANLRGPPRTKPKFQCS